jgi:hypothetical protein
MVNVSTHSESTGMGPVPQFPYGTPSASIIDTFFLDVVHDSCITSEVRPKANVDARWTFAPGEP